jgi:4-diphosphocytidyl-2C-methyl-D-erythritol kinase
VPFFVQGGTALSTGRGETLAVLPDVAPTDLTLFLSDIEVEDKTHRMYAEISPPDYTDGFRTRELADRLRRGAVLDELDLRNAFDPHVGTLARTVVRAMTMCLDGGLVVIAAGSGPAFFGLARRDELSERLLADIERDCGMRAIAARTLSRSESLAMVEV